STRGARRRSARRSQRRRVYGCDVACFLSLIAFLSMDGPMVGYAWIKALCSLDTVATLTHPTKSRLLGWGSVGPPALGKNQGSVRPLTHQKKTARPNLAQNRKGQRNLSSLSNLPGCRGRPLVCPPRYCLGPIE